MDTDAAGINFSVDVIWGGYSLCQVTPASLNQGPAIGLTLSQACASEEIVMSYKLEDDYKHCQGIVNYMVLIV